MAFPLAAAGLIGGANVLAGLIGSKSADRTNAANYMQSKEFAQKGIQWKVKDAKEAGIHPLAAMGAPTVSPTPQVVDDSMGQSVRATAQQLTGMLMQNEAIKADTEVKRTQSLLNLAKVDDIAKIPNLFIDAKDPISGQTIRVLNPEFGQLEGTTAWMGGLHYANPETDLTEMFSGRYKPKSRPKYVNPRTMVPERSGAGRGLPDF